MPKHMQRAHRRAGQRTTQIVQHLRGGAVTEQAGQRLPFLRLGRLQKGQHFSRKQGARRVKAAGITVFVTALLQQVPLDGCLEGDLTMIGNHAVIPVSIFPVTAAATNDARRSTRR